MSASPVPTREPSVLPVPRDGIAGAAPYGAPQLPVAHALNVNENPYGPSEELAAAIGAAAAQAAAGLNRYPDREALDLRRELGEYLVEESGVPAPPAEAVWAANGSNEVMHQLMLAYGGPGRTALGFTPHYSMYPEYARDTFTAWVTAERGPAPDFALTAETVTAAIAEHRPSIVVLTSPNNPTGTALDLDVARAQQLLPFGAAGGGAVREQQTHCRQALAQRGQQDGGGAAIADALRPRSSAGDDGDLAGELAGRLVVLPAILRPRVHQPFLAGFCLLLWG